MQFITTTVNDFRHFIEPNSSQNLIDAYDRSTNENISFVDFALRQLNPLRSEFEDSLTEVLLPIGKSEKDDLLNNLNAELDYLIRLSGSLKKDKEGFFVEYFNDFKRHFNEKYNRTYSSERQTQPNVEKIKWLGNINTLSTFLIQLHSGENTVAQPLIDCEISVLKEFIIRNFSDQNGRDISISTLNTYFDTNKMAEKQAKKRVLQVNNDGTGFAVKAANIPEGRVREKPSQYAVPKDYKPSE